MSEHIFLVRDMSGEARFDATKLRDCLQNMAGVSSWREGEDTVVSDTLLFDCAFGTEDNETRISVPKELRYVSIGGVGDASLQAAINIHKCYRETIHAVLAGSPGYHVDLSDVASASNLRERLKL